MGEMKESMVMADTEVGEGKEISVIKSVWKTSLSDVNGDELSVMGTGSWPALADAAAETVAAAAAAAAETETPALAPPPIQGQHQRPDVNMNPYIAPMTPYQPLMTPYQPLMAPYQPLMAPMVPSPQHIPPYGQGGYGHPYGQGGYGHPYGQGGYGHPYGQGGYGHPYGQGGYGQLDPNGRHHNMQQGMRPMPFVRPPYLGHSPHMGPRGFNPRFSGLPMGFMPPMRGLHPPPFVPYPVYTAPPQLPSPDTLKTLIMKQIEFYFSAENLEGDYHLRGLMDEQEWVPITDVAKFHRIKRMSTNIPFILDSLKDSSSVEVKDDKIRKRR